MYACQARCCKEERIMKSVLGRSDENKLNQKQIEINSEESGLVSLPLKPPPSKKNSVVYDINGNELSYKRQSIMIVEDYILSDDKPRKLHSRISITDFKRQLHKKKRQGQIMQYRSRYYEASKNRMERADEDNKLLQEDTKLLQLYLVEDEMNTSLDYVVETLSKEKNQNTSTYSNSDTIIRCIMCNRILYDLILYEEADRLKNCVCSNCIKSYNSMIETINNYEYLSSPILDNSIICSNDSNNKQKGFSDKLKQTLKDLLK